MYDTPTPRMLEEILEVEAPIYPDDTWLDSASGQLATIGLAYEIIARQEDSSLAGAVRLILLAEREEAYRQGFREGVADALAKAEEENRERARLRRAIVAGVELREAPWWRRLARKVLGRG
jgi:transcriptional regulator GlxA family with amidase domain